MTEQSLRIDKWLWHTRFFKTRSLATEAVNGGKVHLNDQRVKAGRAVSIGDRLAIQKHNDIYEITVTGIINTRRPAKEAQQCYTESEQSILRREKEREIRRLASSSRPVPQRRPGKRERQQLRDFKLKS